MIGTELLLGQTVDTNAAFLASELAAAGVHVFFKSTVGDNRDRMATTIERALERSEIVITSGGLGPTEDDLTREIVADVVGVELTEDEEALRQIEAVFHGNKWVMTPSNRKQALIPQGAVVVPNALGTAPGFIVEHGDKTVVCLPGVPNELKAMLTENIIPYLSRRYDLDATLFSEDLKFVGIGESNLEERLRDLLQSSNPTVAPYAGLGEVKIRLTARAADAEEAKTLFAPIEQEILRRVGEYMYGRGDDTLPGVAGQALQKAGWTLALAESCTGGLIARRLTDVPGSSAYFPGGIVAYSNEAKETLLGVPADTLRKHGAVSEQTAAAMALGARERFGATMGVAVTGIAGPAGGTATKPVGLVFIGISRAETQQTFRFEFGENRERVRWQASQTALDLIRRHAVEET